MTHAREGCLQVGRSGLTHTFRGIGLRWLSFMTSEPIIGELTYLIVNKRPKTGTDGALDKI